MTRSAERRPTRVPGRDTASVVLVRGEVEVASWPLVVTGRPDVTVADELARLAVAARRLGCSIRLRNASGELVELLDLLGLADLLCGRNPVELEVGREAEGGEQGRVEEVVVPDDPVP